ncbi:hypothetical protein [Frankia gtarii]|uniref:hypothetical protein n=1 Tax=Frankia gtarii TaxID=2950102 RepID=UPI0021C0FC78|nr:hypothetical protein [Frankia gtarii]
MATPAATTANTRPNRPAGAPLPAFLTVAVPLVAVPLVAVPLVAVPLVAVPLVAVPLVVVVPAVVLMVAGPRADGRSPTGEIVGGCPDRRAASALSSMLSVPSH